MITITQGDTLRLKTPLAAPPVTSLTVTFPGSIVQDGSAQSNETDGGIVYKVWTFADAATLAVGNYSLPVVSVVNGISIPGTLNLAVQTAGTSIRQSAIQSMVEGYLQKDAGFLSLPALASSALFSGEYAFLSAELPAKFPCIGSPSALAGNDAVFFDRALSLLIAARLYQPLTTGAAGGNITALATADGSKEQYTAPNADTAERWAKDAISALCRVSCVQSAISSTVSGFSLVYTAGPRRRCSGGPDQFFGWGTGFLDYGAFPLCGLPLGMGLADLAGLDFAGQEYWGG